MTDQQEVFNAYSRYYDLLYRDKDYIGEAEYIHSLLNHYGLSRGELLEFGSGTGKHGRLLAEMGYKVLGIERSASMVEQAVNTAGFECRQGDICTVRLGRTFDAVLSLFHVMSYQTTNAKVRDFFASAAAHLQPGGLFIFDFWYSPAVYAQRPEVRVKRMSDEKVRITRIAEPVIYPNTNCVDVNYTIYAIKQNVSNVQELNETHSMRHFSLPEVDLIAELYGFQRIGAEEFLSRKPVGENTWGVCVILRKG